jgi:hypothetical protein
VTPFGAGRCILPEAGTYEYAQNHRPEVNQFTRRSGVGSNLARDFGLGGTFSQPETISRKDA